MLNTMVIIGGTAALWVGGVVIRGVDGQTLEAGSRPVYGPGYELGCTEYEDMLLDSEMVVMSR